MDEEHSDEERATSNETTASEVASGEDNPTRSKARRVVRIAAPVLAILILLVMLAPGAPASWALSRAISGSVSKCVNINGLDLDLGSWPVIPRAGLGRVSNLSATADSVDLKGLRLSDVKFSIDSLDYSPLQWIGRDGPVTIKNGKTTAHITEADLNSYMSRDLPGLNIDLGNDVLMLDVAIPILGNISVPLKLELDSGGLLLTADINDTSPTLASLLPGLRVEPPLGMQMTKLDVVDGSITMSANFEIDGKLEPIACDAAGGVKLSSNR